MKGWKDEIKGMVHLRANETTVEKEVDGQWTALLQFTTEIRVLDDLAYNRVGVIVKPSKEAPERNGYLIDYNGKILWQIQSVHKEGWVPDADDPYPYDPWVGFGYRDGKFVAKTQDGFIFEIDEITGRIIELIEVRRFC